MPIIREETANRDVAKAAAPTETVVAVMTATSVPVHQGRRNPVTVAGHHVPNSAAADRHRNDAIWNADPRHQHHLPCRST